MPFRPAFSRFLAIVMGGLLLAPLGVAHARVLVETQLERTPGAMVLDARSVLANPAIRRSVRVWIAHPGASLVIQPPAGVFGRVWAESLRSWLVALGLPAESIRVRPALERGETLLLVVRTPTS